MAIVGDVQLIRQILVTAALASSALALGASAPASAQKHAPAHAIAVAGGDAATAQPARVHDKRRLRRSATAFMRRYYRRVSRHRYAEAWAQLSNRVKRGIGSFDSWKAGQRQSRGVVVRSARARLSGGRSVVSISLRSSDRDICSGRSVHQTFRGRWVLAPRGDSWLAVGEHMRKTGGGTPRLSTSECPAPEPPPPPPPPPPAPPTDCQGYDPCITPGPDVDCAGGAGNGPRYTGPVRVTGSDPYGLDSDGDGYGCEDSG